MTVDIVIQRTADYKYTKNLKKRQILSEFSQKAKRNIMHGQYQEHNWPQKCLFFVNRLNPSKPKVYFEARGMLQVLSSHSQVRYT